MLQSSRVQSYLLAVVPAVAGLNAASATFEVIKASAEVVDGTTAVHALVLIPASEAQDAAGKALQLGAVKVWIVPVPEPVSSAHSDDVVTLLAAAVAAIAGQQRKEPLVTLFAAGPAGEEFAARVAMRRGGVALGRCASLGIADEVVHARRAACGGRASLHIECQPGNVYAAMRASNRPVATSSPLDIAANTSVLAIGIPLRSALCMDASKIDTSRRVLPLERARVVVCGGRGMGDEMAFRQLAELAECLGGTVAGTLPAVDSGWVPVAFQVGQSGKYVTPELYIAVGVSGTPQHMAGVDPHSRIVAINSDRHADIFAFSEMGLVADWRKAVPALLAALSKR
ncbi:MAG: electron transfer flavoprotein subunit alpha/FixB family protein [Steroidobacteraceae bacterium]